MSNIARCRLFLGALTLVGLLSASSAYSALRPPSQRAGVAPGASHLVAFGSRGPLQALGPNAGKLDGALADLARHASAVRPGHQLEDLHAMSPAARFMQRGAEAEPMVLVDAITRGDPQRLEAALLTLGLQHASLYRNDVSGWLPVRQIIAATAHAEVHALRAAMSRTRAGAVTSQGDFVQGSSALRTTYPSLTGAGVKVGVLSDSYDCYHVYAQPGSGVPASGANGYASNGFTADAAKDVSTGDLPSGVQVLDEAGQNPPLPNTPNLCKDFGAPYYLPYGDEGRAMMQIVHDVAPGASLAFHTALEGEADFANGITALAAAGAKVIVDDVGYFDEPFFQDSLVGEAIDTVEGQGVAYFSAAGNDGRIAYDNTNPSFGTPSGPPNTGEMLLNFDTSGATTTTSLPVTIPAGLVPGEFVVIVVEWDQPYVTGAPSSGGATSQIDLCVDVTSGSDEIVNGNAFGTGTTCTGKNAVGKDPVQVLLIGIFANAASNSAQETVKLQVGLAGGAAPSRIKISIEGNGAPVTINSFFTPSPTLQGHPGATGAAAVGAAYFQKTPACGISPAVLESFSSMGGDPIIFDSTGKRVAMPPRQKPDFVAPDGVNNTFLGFVLKSTGSGVLQCQNDLSFPSFFGTSAAAPHAAAVAALMLQSNPSVTPSEIYSDLRSTALPMTATPPDFQSGYGFIQADAALALMAPGAAPAVSVAPMSITVGTSATVTWSSINTTGCAASGSWSGMLAPNGTMSITPPAVGTYTYTLVCSNPHGSTPSGSATLTVTAAPTFTAPGSLMASAASSSQINLSWAAATESGGTISQYRIERCQGSGCSGFAQIGTSTTLAFSDTGLGGSTTYGYRVRAADAQGNTGPYSSVASATTAAAPPPPSGGGGGGALDGTLILALAGLTGARWLRQARARERRSTTSGTAR